VSVLPPRCLCLVTDRRRAAPDARTQRDEIVALEAWLDEAIDAGIDLIQIRERDLDGGVLARTTARIVSRSAGTATRIVVNDRADVALGAGAAGVHVRDDGPSVRRIQALALPGWMIGRSLHRAIDFSRHAEATYFVFGTVFPTVSKNPGTPVHGIEGLRSAVRSTTVPILAIGGIDTLNARICLDAGAVGIAAIGLFLPAGREPGAIGVAKAVSEIKQG
jgi:thiamine-phosphate pyrophosphorylase